MIETIRHKDCVYYTPNIDKGEDGKMRIVWKDSRTYKVYSYRGHTIKRYQNGWITDIPGDDNIYYSAEHAHNAADKILGGKTRKANPGRQALGIKVVGKKDRKDVLSCG